jgi:peroxiredoxin
MGTKGKMTNIVAGNAAPVFSLKALDGTEFSLVKLREHGPVVAAFFKVSCPVCQFTFARRRGRNERLCQGIRRHFPDASR